MPNIFKKIVNRALITLHIKKKPTKRRAFSAGALRPPLHGMRNTRGGGGVPNDGPDSSSSSDEVDVLPLPDAIQSSHDLLNQRMRQEMAQPSVRPKSTEDTHKSDDFFQYTQDYIDTFKNKRKFSEIIDEMKLTAEEELLLKPFEDPISQDVMDLPVMLHEQAFDLNSLLDILKVKGTNPLTRLPFAKCEIQAGRQVYNQIEETIKQINDARLKQKSDTSQKHNETNMQYYWVYMLLCKNNSYYTGYTNNLEKRYEAHLNGTASKYTRSFKPISIAHSWKVSEKSEAMKLERRIKHLSRAEKENLIANPNSLFI